MQKTRRREGGFSLLELLIVLLIIGLIIGGAMAMIRPYVIKARMDTTQQKLSNIATSIAFFTQNYGHLPCPARPNPGGAEPFGAPVNSGVDGTGLNNNCVVAGTPFTRGVVPFRALGLDEDNVRDAYGNLITYAVTWNLTRNPATVAPVHRACRTALWMDEVTARNKNLGKANFCCAAHNAALTLNITDGQTRSVFPNAHDPADYAASDVPSTAPPIADSRFIAFVLVSHGANGDGAYIRDSNNRNPVTVLVSSGVPADVQEAANKGDDLNFVAADFSTADNVNFFDDIVTWRTNDQVISAFGNNSCGKP